MMHPSAIGLIFYDSPVQTLSNSSHGRKTLETERRSWHWKSAVFSTVVLPAGTSRTESCLSSCRRAFHFLIGRFSRLNNITAVAGIRVACNLLRSAAGGRSAIALSLVGTRSKSRDRVGSRSFPATRGLPLSGLLRPIVLISRDRKSLLAAPGKCEQERP